MPSPRPLCSLNLNLQIPHHFRCPISLELMDDPVILCTGHTYDRSSIEKWVTSGNTTCPVTMQKLHDFTLIPNHTLRRLIQEWCVSNRSRGVERIPTPKQPADPCKIRSLLAEASLSGAENAGARIFAMKALRNLVKESDKNRPIMADGGALPIIIESLFETVSMGASTSEDDDAQCACGELQEEALATLVVLPLSDSDRLSMVQPARLWFLSEALRCGSMETRVNAAALIEMLCDSKEINELRVLVANTKGVMEGLVKLLEKATHPRAVKVGIKAVFSLCLRKQGKARAVEAGVASCLIERLAQVEKGDAERALGAIELLCTTEGGCREVANHRLAVSVLVKVILKVSDRATEYAAGSLLAICSYSERVQRDAVELGIVKELLLLIQSDCTERGKTKAMNLLKLLRGSWVSNNDPCMPESGRTDVMAF